MPTASATSVWLIRKKIRRARIFCPTWVSTAVGPLRLVDAFAMSEVLSSKRNPTVGTNRMSRQNCPPADASQPSAGAGLPGASCANETSLQRAGALTIRQSFLAPVVNTLLRFRPCPEASAPEPELMTSFRKINSPVALATCGMFLVPEPFGACLLLAAAIWWLWRKAGCPCRSMLSSFREAVRRGPHYWLVTIRIKR
jgi:hypothetical protein